MRKIREYPWYCVPVIIWFTYMYVKEQDTYHLLALTTMLIISLVILVLTTPKKKANITQKENDTQ